MLRAGVIENSGRRIDMKVSAGAVRTGARRHHGQPRRRAPANSPTTSANSNHVRDFFTSTSIVSVIDLLFIGVFLGLLVHDRRRAGAGAAARRAGRAGGDAAHPGAARASVNAAQLTKTSRHSILVELMVGIETVKAIAGEGAAAEEMGRRGRGLRARQFRHAVLVVAGDVFLAWRCSNASASCSSSGASIWSPPATSPSAR